MVRRGEAAKTWHGKARLGLARLLWLGLARQGSAGLGMAGMEFRRIVAGDRTGDGDGLLPPACGSPADHFFNRAGLP